MPLTAARQDSLALGSTAAKLLIKQIESGKRTTHNKPFVNTPWIPIMFILHSYRVAVVFCIITMLCCGSWANIQKLAGATWRFELFYWNYVVSVMLMALIFAFTLDSMGRYGRSGLADLCQAKLSSIGSSLLGSIIFNAANILLVAAIALAGMSVAFPVGIGLALVIGVLVNYLKMPKGRVCLAGIRGGSSHCPTADRAHVSRISRRARPGDTLRGVIVLLIE